MNEPFFAVYTNLFTFILFVNKTLQLKTNVSKQDFFTVTNINKTFFTVTQCSQKYAANYNSSCYKFVLEPADWMKAYVDCRMEGAHLISLETTEEFNFIQSYIKTSSFLSSFTGNCSKWLFQYFCILRNRSNSIILFKTLFK